MDSVNKRICILSNRHEYFKRFFENGNYSIIDLPYPLSLSDLARIKTAGKFDYCLIEPQRESQDSVMDIMDSLKDMGRPIFILHEISGQIRSLFMKKGIVDVLHSGDADHVLSYINILDKGHDLGTGKIIIMEDNEIRKKILDDIISRFGYNAIFVESANELCDNLNNATLQFLLINLGINYTELNNFVRACFNRVELRGVPIISYKDMTEGLFVHEIVKGLNRLTRFILSPEELYSFLINVLFKKDIMPVVDSLNVSVDFKNSSQYAFEPLRRIYFMKDGEIIYNDNLLRDENIEKLFGLAELMRISMVRISGFRWLKKECAADHLFTCGAGV